MTLLGPACRVWCATWRAFIMWRQATRERTARRRCVVVVAGWGAVMLFGLPWPATAQSGLVIGWNHPAVAYGHDFGVNAWGHDGIVTSGWSYQTFVNSQGFTDTSRVDAGPCSGRPALRIAADLRGQHREKASGEVELSLLSHPPLLGPVPVGRSLDLEGVTVRVRLWLPPGSAGAASAPNGLQLIFKTRRSDTDYPSLYTPWLNIERRWEGSCVDVIGTVSNSGAGQRTPGFDARDVALIGLKIGINSNSIATVSDFVYIDEFTLDTTPPTAFTFEQLELERDFAIAKRLSHDQFRVVRVFVFADGRASPEFGSDGSVLGLEPQFYADFDEMLRIAERQRVLLMPVLLDFTWCARPKIVSGVTLGGHSDVIRDPGKRQTFLDGALLPFLQRYGASPWIYAIDVINEPEWMMAGVPDSPPPGADVVTVSEMQEFVRLTTDYIHRFSRIPVTAGSARRMWLQFWQGLGLDLYQFHWYDQFENQEPFPWRPYSELGLDRPCIVGEVPTANTKYAANRYVQATRDGGYAGVLFWSFRANDAFSDFATASSTFPNPLLTLDAPGNGARIGTGFSVSGWAIDRSAVSGTGIDAVHVYAFPNPGSGTPGIFLGVATYGIPRPDVGAFLGSQFTNSGYSLNVAGLAAGTYQIAAFGRSTLTDTFSAVASAVVTVQPPVSRPVMSLDGPQSNSTVGRTVTVAGWAVDLGSSNGTGVDAVHVWAYPNDGSAAQFLGVATHGLSRPDIGAALGSRFTNSGYRLSAVVSPPGVYRIVAFAHSTVANAFNAAVGATNVTVQDTNSNAVLFVDTPGQNTSPTRPFTVSGWAVDSGSTSGTGIDAIHVWAFPTSGAAATFVGVATYGTSRPDIGTLFGETRFNNSGFTFTVNSSNLVAGTYDLIVFGRSTVTNGFTVARVVRVNVQ